jgi:hypothetical protein
VEITFIRFENGSIRKKTITQSAALRTPGRRLTDAQQYI